MLSNRHIAIGGKMTSGKTTLTHALMDAIPEEDMVYHLSFAGPIREALAIIGVTKEKQPEMYREGAQYIGTDFVRRYDPNWWTNLMESKIDTLTDDDPWLIIDDMRFKNEFDLLKRKGFVMVRLMIDEHEQLVRGANMDRLDHPSETGLDNIPHDQWDIIMPQSTSVEQRVQWLLQLEGTITTESVPQRDEPALHSILRQPDSALSPTRLSQ
jgi:hypothetical protein